MKVGGVTVVVVESQLEVTIFVVASVAKLGHWVENQHSCMLIYVMGAMPRF